MVKAKIHWSCRMGSLVRNWPTAVAIHIISFHSNT